MVIIIFKYTSKYRNDVIVKGELYRLAGGAFGDVYAVTIVRNRLLFEKLSLLFCKEEKAAMKTAAVETLNVTNNVRFEVRVKLKIFKKD